MKHAMLLALLLAAPGAPAMDSPSNGKSIEIRLEPYPKARDERQLTRILLTKDYEGFRCKTDAVPDHRIQVKGLTALTPPALPRTISPGCQVLLTWGNSKSCYVKHENPMVDELIRWCLNL